MSTVLVIGSTGQVGRVVVEEALSCGFAVRAQSRNAARAQRSLPGGVEVVEASPPPPTTCAPSWPASTRWSSPTAATWTARVKAVSTPPSPRSWTPWVITTRTSAS